MTSDNAINGDAVIGYSGSVSMVAEDEAEDWAMLFGANYPFGPLNWVTNIGYRNIVSALDAISACTGVSIYQPSKLLVSRAELE